MLKIGITYYLSDCAPAAFRWTVAAAIRAVCRLAVNLDKLRKINLVLERVRYRLKVRLVTVNGELYTGRQTRGNVLHELMRVTSVATAHKPRNDQF